MAVSLTHCLDECIRGARFSIVCPCVGDDGLPSVPTVPAGQYSTDGGVTWHACAETPLISGTWMRTTLTALETDATSLLFRLIESGDASHEFVQASLTPHRLATTGPMTAAGGGTLHIILSVSAYSSYPDGTMINSWVLQGAGAAVEARRIREWACLTCKAVVTHDWETQPTEGTTFYVGRWEEYQEPASVRNAMVSLPAGIAPGAAGGLAICGADGRVAASVEEVTEDGQADVADAVEAGLAAYDAPSLTDLELMTEDIEEAVTAIVAALHDLSSAEAQTACAAALAAYDAATGTDVGNLTATTIITVPSAEQTDVARCYADSAPWDITVQDDDGGAVDLTDLTLYLGIDEHQTTAYASASVKLDSTAGGGLTVLSAVDGQIEVDAGELDELAVGDWWYTLRRANVAGETLTLVRGKLEVRWAI